MSEKYIPFEHILVVSSQEIGEKSNMSVKREYVAVIPPINAPLEENKVSFAKSMQNEGFTTLSAIDSFTASRTKEEFIREIDEKVEGRIYDISVRCINSMRSVPIIWNDNDFKHFARYIQKKYGRNADKIPLARKADSSTRDNGRFTLSRLIALIYKHREYAEIQFGRALISGIISYDKCMAKEKEGISFTVEEITSALEQIYLGYDKIREIYITLDSKEKEKEKDQEQKIFYLAKEENGKYRIWDFKREGFYDQESFIYCVEPFSIGFIDAFTSNYSGPLYLDRSLEGPEIASDNEGLCDPFQREPTYNSKSGNYFKMPKKPPRFCIISFDGGITEEFIPIFRGISNHICDDYSCEKLNDIINNIDTHGYYGGADDNRFVSSIIKKYCEITPADQLSNGISPCFTYYPYVSYLELRKMINAILIYNEQKRARANEELIKKVFPN